MIVRTYGRRNRGITGSYSSNTAFNDVIDVDSDDPFRDSLSQENPQDFYSIPFSSQNSSSNWALDSQPYNSSVLVLDDSPDGTGVRKSKKARNGKRESSELGGNSKGVVRNGTVTPIQLTTKTLMETQEFGEMMEHVDEVNFALDGLRKDQPARIRRASLLTLLSISSSAQQRRLLRTEGMARTIIDAILNLNLDDSPSNLAASALLYVLTCDGQDDHILESPRSIKFLLDLLKPPTADTIKEKTPSIGGKLVAFRKDGARDSTKGMESCSAAITRQVEEILVSCKDLKCRIGDDKKPELCPEWIALLTMEKACLSTISLEDATGAIRQSGGNFKEKVRELGGLQAVFDVATNCHSDMEKLLEHSSFDIWESKDDVRSLVLVLKCLKIMENATFLSKDNQSHLLQMKGNLKGRGSTVSFIKLMIKAIKILSGLSLRRRSPAISKKYCDNLNKNVHCFELAVVTNDKVENDCNFSTTSKACCSKGRISSKKSFGITRKSQWLSTTRSEDSIAKSEITSFSKCGTSSVSCKNLEKRISISIKESYSKQHVGSKNKHCIAEDAKIGILEDSQDPFAFDGDDFEPSKWDLFSGKPNVARKRKHRETKCFSDSQDDPFSFDGDEHQLQMIMMGKQDSSYQNSQNSSCSAAGVNEENPNLVADCLLTVIKVLMNLTNENPVGCKQIAACGGLETMCLLIASHFPSFTLSPSPLRQIEEDERHLNDQELDFLVAILGLLVNLVEKDGLNRSRLAAASVSLSSSSELSGEENRRDVIPLLCSIFLANQGAGEAAAEEGKVVARDEDAVLQGEKEAEKMIIEAYAALLLAFLSTESKSIRDAITDCLPEHNLAILVPVLERFVEFHLTLNMISPETHIAVSQVIESCRIR